MELALRILMYMIIISLIRSVFKRQDKIDIENTVIILPIYSKILKICALILIAFCVIFGVVFMLFSSADDLRGFLIVELIFGSLTLVCLLFALYVDCSRIVFDDEKLIDSEFLAPRKEILYKDIVSCETYGKRYVIRASNGKKVNVDLSMINADVLLKKIKDSGVSTENAFKSGYYIKPKLSIIILLLIFLLVATFIDVECFIKGSNPGIKGIIFTSIAPVFLIIFGKEKYYVKNNKITRKFLFCEKETVDISLITKIEERKDILEGKHLMVYVSGQEKALFDIDASYMSIDSFMEDMIKRKKISH